MSQLRTTDADVLRIRFAVSPVWETVSAVWALRRPGPGWLQPWRAGVTDHDGLRPLSVLLGHRGYVPDFVTPPPRAGERSLAAELALVRAVPTEVVAHELQRCRDERQDEPDPLLTEMAARPAWAHRRIDRALDLAWTHLVAPFWPRLHRVLAGDLDHRSRRLLKGGLTAVLQDLHPDVEVHGDVITVHNGVRDERALSGQGIVLLPSVFHTGRPVVFVDPPYQPMIAYPARGVATVWDQAPAPADALVGLLGRGRADVLARLDAPAGTGDLALQLGRSAGTISEHVSALRAAGLVETVRAGRGSRHGRTALGDALVAGPVGQPGR